jgi:hypothetical protein
MNKGISGREYRNCHNLQPHRDVGRWLACEGALAASPASGSGNGFGHTGWAPGAALQSFLALQQHRCILDGRGLATLQKLLEKAAERAHFLKGNLPRATSRVSWVSGATRLRSTCKSRRKLHRGFLLAVHQ